MFLVKGLRTLQESFGKLKNKLNQKISFMILFIKKTLLVYKNYWKI